MACTGLNARTGAAIFALAPLLAAAPARASGAATDASSSASSASNSASSGGGMATSASGEGASTPQHLAQAFIQYGVAFTGEFVVAPGPICPATVECILGTGGGLTLRVGWRLRAPFYIGAAYEFSKQEPQQLYRLAILQQARAEGRYYIVTGRSTEPYIFGSVGAAGYGNLWGVDTAGPTFGLGAGAEFQLSTYLVIGLSMTYRAIFFTPFHDTAGVDRPAGFSHLLGIDLILETRDPF